METSKLIIQKYELIEAIINMNEDDLKVFAKAVEKVLKEREISN